MTINKGLMAMLMVVLLSACSLNPNTHYASVNHYPYYEGRWSEMDYSPHATTFMLWAPNAQEVRVLLYNEAEGGAPARMHVMSCDDKGMWSLSVKGNLEGKYYAFNVKRDDVWRGDVQGLMPKAAGTLASRAAIIDLMKTQPAGWLSEKEWLTPVKDEKRIYRMDIDRFTTDTAAHFVHPRKYLALTEEHLRTFTGEPAGIAFLKSKGVTHISLPMLVEGAVTSAPTATVHQLTVPQLSYATQALPETAIREFKQMVMALHRNGMRVMMDLDCSRMVSPHGAMEKILPHYFINEVDDADAPQYLLETERPMAARLLSKWAKWWINEYHLDGLNLLNDSLIAPATLQQMHIAMKHIDAGTWLARPAELEAIVKADTMQATLYPKIQTQPAPAHKKKLKRKKTR